MLFSKILGSTITTVHAIKTDKSQKYPQRR
jgi:hypothetical protein